MSGYQLATPKQNDVARLVLWLPAFWSSKFGVAASADRDSEVNSDLSARRVLLNTGLSLSCLAHLV
jgi:hypothetical protein